MRIAFIITGLSGDGAENMLFKLLKNLDRKQFQPMVISLSTLGDIGPRIQALNIPVVALDMNSNVPNPLKFLKLIWLLLKYHPDVVHTWMYHADLLGGLAARLAGCSKVVWCIRHSDFAGAESKRSTILVFKACAMLSSVLPEKILSCSTRAKQMHVTAGYPDFKMQVIPNGFELDCYLPNTDARRSVKAELVLDNDALLVGLIGRYNPQKNHLGFIEAAANIHKINPNVHFLLAGRGVDVENKSLQYAIAKHGLQSNIHLLGRREDIPRLMASLDVLVSASSFGEAFPNVLGEAMACAIPCVVTDVGDSAEIVGNGGYVISPGDMEGLARNVLAILHATPAERGELKQRAYTRVAAEYEIGVVTRRYQDFYRTLVV